MSEPIAFPSETPRFALPLLFSGQAQKELTVNESIASLDLLVHACVEDEVDAPPGAPQAGQAWLIGSMPSGLFAARPGHIAGWTDGGWRFIAPRDGMRLFDRARGCFLVHADGWISRPAPDAPSGGTVIDAEARAFLTNLVSCLRDLGVFA